MSHYWGGQLDKLAKENKVMLILQALSVQEHKKVLSDLCTRDEAQQTINGLSPIRHDVIVSVLEVGRWQLNEEFIKICKPLIDLIGDTESRDITLADLHSRTLRDAFGIALCIAEKWGWAQINAEQLLKDIQAYANEEAPFTGSKADAIAWWKSVNIGFHPIQVFALKMMSIVPHVAEVEHFFSNLGGVQSMKRSQLYEVAIAEGKDPRHHHGHMHITSKGIDTDCADILTESFSIPVPLATSFEGSDLDGPEGITMEELDAEFSALEQSAFTAETGDGLSVTIPVRDVYDISLIDKICDGQLPTFQNMVAGADIGNDNSVWDADSLLHSMGV
ncbi:hypothetical protein BDQ17DRAFT_1432726 [Cyathus striatus]|nr:hypothetical protein BDQ17DRAFT_1432726 [Cyathus striatus]